jgi:hypothetical protein
MTKRIIGLFIVAVVAAAICVPIVFFVHKTLMPSDAELKQIDALVLKTVSIKGQSCTIERQSSPDRVELEGETKEGYFTYEVRCSGTESKLHAEWKIENGHIELTSVVPL